MSTDLRRPSGEGRYANYFEIGFNAFEFVLDFGQAYADDEFHDLHTRIVLTPEYARILARLLGESLEKHGASIRTGDKRGEE